MRAVFWDIDDYYTESFAEMGKSLSDLYTRHLNFWAT